MALSFLAYLCHMICHSNQRLTNILSKSIVFINALSKTQEVPNTMDEMKEHGNRAQGPGLLLSHAIAALGKGKSEGRGIFGSVCLLLSVALKLVQRKDHQAWVMGKPWV